MTQKPIKELIEPFKTKWLSKQTGINYSTLKSQLNGNRKLTLENELKIRQLLTK